jgi:hypothetical protein
VKRLPRLAPPFALALASALALPALGAQDQPSFTVGGAVGEQPFFRYQGSLPAEASDLSYGSNASLGIDLNVAGSRARATASFEAAVLSGAAAADAWEAKAAGLDPPDLLLVPAWGAGSPAPGTLVEARIRALYVKLDFDWASLAAGRQVVNYLRGELWSPTDIFTELDLSGLSPVRRGSDALRLVFPLGATGALDLVAAPTADPSRGRYATRLSGFIAGLDSSVLASRDGDGRFWNAGADFKTDLVVGLNGEALCSIPDSGRPWLRAALGTDYSIGDFVMAAEYYYNGGGARADLSAPGRHNGYASLVWKASDFVRLAGQVAADLVSGNWTGSAQAILDAAQNASAALYAKLGREDSGPAPWSAELGLSLAVKF